jgi:hypothetical protein
MGSIFGDAINNLFGGNASYKSERTANIPARSPEETNLLNLQSDALSRSMKLQKLLLPHQLQMLGLTPSYDANGEITGVTQDPAQKGLQDEYTKFASMMLKGQEENAPAAAQIQKMYNDRTLAALRGEVPIDPALTQSLNDRQRALTNSLRTQLGTGAETTSAGIETQGRFDLNRMIAEETARRSDISTSQTMGLNQTASNANAGMTSAELSSQLKGMNLSELLGLPSATGAASSAVNPFMQLSNQFRLGAGQLNLGAAGLDMSGQIANQKFAFDLYKQMGSDVTKIFGGKGIGGGE